MSPVLPSYIKATEKGSGGVNDDNVVHSASALSTFGICADADEEIPIRRVLDILHKPGVRFDRLNNKPQY